MLIRNLYIMRTIRWAQRPSGAQPRGVALGLSYKIVTRRPRTPHSRHPAHAHFAGSDTYRRAS